MTTNSIIQYYADLLILQYRGRPKARATIVTQVTPVVMDQLPTQVQNGFNLDTAIGVQLDTLAKYAGVTRTGNTFTGPVTLSDDDFRSLIKIAIVRNSSGSSLSDIQNLIHIFFPDQILVFDHQNMRMDYFIDSSVGSLELLEIFITEGLLPKPMAVGIGIIIFAPDITHFFGFRTYEHEAYNVSPFNDYADFKTNWPWLSYADVVSF